MLTGIHYGKGKIIVKMFDGTYQQVQLLTALSDKLKQEMLDYEGQLKQQFSKPHNGLIVGLQTYDLEAVQNAMVERYGDKVQSLQFMRDYTDYECESFDY